jgi:DNA-binding MarR family transcriptional regulator
MPTAVSRPASRPASATNHATNHATDRAVDHAVGQTAGELPQGCTNFRLRQLLRRVARLYDVEFAKAGLKGTQYSLLSQIVARGPIQPNELARRMGMDASTLTRNLRVVVASGWALQRPGADERSRLVEITAAGRAKQVEAKRYWKKAQGALIDLLGVEQVKGLHALIDDSLERLAEVAGAD